MIETSLFTLRQLACFVAACDEGGIALAATRLNLAQATVSESIADLERSLGIQLLVRAPRRRAIPSSAGRSLLPNARAVISAAGRVGQRSAELRGTVAGELPVGCLITLAPVAIPRIFGAFETSWPQAQATLHTGDQPTLLGWLEDATIDVALTYDLALDASLSFTPLAAFPAYALVGAGHPLARRRSVTLARLAREPLVLLDLPLSREYFLDLYREAGVEPVIDRKVSDPELLRSLVANGFGYTLANARPIPTASVDGMPLVAIPVSGTTRALVVGLVRRAGVVPTLTATAFADVCAVVLAPVLDP